MKNEVFIGLTYGDPAGIGPEILLKTLNNWKFKFKPLIVGTDDYLKCIGKTKCKNIGFVYPNHKNPKFKLKKIVPGKPSLYSAIHSYECLKHAVSLALSQKIHALVTGPVSKYIMQSYKSMFLGQTDEIAKLCKINSDDVIMSFISNDLRIALYTRHVPVSKVHSLLTARKFKNYIILLNEQIKKWFSIKTPNIAVLGLNPHAGESGTLGIEEKSIISPAIDNLRKIGINVSGPYSSDAMLGIAGRDYLLGKKQKYDFYVSMFHDQCLPMFKAVAGFNGVNVSLGLPFLRVSPDHGTAFDIVGKNKASSESYLSAVKLLDDLL